MTTPELPPQTRKKIRRIFDFFHDDTPVTNAIRKWGPVQLLLLQDGSSEGPRGWMSCINWMARDWGDSSACFPVLLQRGSVFGYLIWYDLMGKVQKKHAVKFNHFKL